MKFGLGRKIAVLGAGVIAAGAVGVFASLIPLDGEARSEWRMWGRLHPLLVHFPVALLMLVPLLELGGRRWLAWRESALVILRIGVVGALCAVLAGLALVQADGHEGAGVERHLWGGVGVALGATMAWIARELAMVRVYPAVLLVTVCMLGWAAHQGGNLTHGQYYLTEGLPPEIRKVLRIPEPPVPEEYAKDTVYGAAVFPVLNQYCLSCHGPSKQKGNYRMDTFALMIAGGQSELLAVKAGRPNESELLRRMLLPIADKKAMPPQGQPRPSEANIALLKWWIANGASRELSLREATQSDPQLLAVLQAVQPGIASEIPKVGDYSASWNEIQQLAQRLDVHLVPISKRAGDGLILRTRNREQKVTNQTIELLRPAAQFIVEAELAGTAIDDEGILYLREFKNLERLSLERTAITGSSLKSLAGLAKLSTLNLNETALTDSGLGEVAALPNLRRLYVANSGVSEEAIASLIAIRPDCELPGVP
jgi:uncharacterized membrane protein